MSVYLTNFMHGAGVTDAKKELYIGVGLNQDEQRVFEQVFQDVPKHRKHIVGLPEGVGPLGYMMVGYALVGKIQASYPAFQERVNKYSLSAKNWERPLLIWD